MFRRFWAQGSVVVENEKDDVQLKRGVRAFTHMVCCHLEEALNYKLNLRAPINLSVKRASCSVVQKLRPKDCNLNV